MKECKAWVVDVKKARKLEANLVEMEKVMAQLQSIRQAEFEMKDAFCEVERERGCPWSCRRLIKPCF